jgi:NAD(P)-dependent dehydrogenase (short-subunit alcohol dehydrogenase family)
MNATGKLLENRCAIVTGGSEGLGYAIARQYLEAGASVLVCARRDPRVAEAAAALRKLAGPGQSVIALSADVSRPDDAAALVERALREFGRLDILVNNAGVAGPSGRAERVDWDEWVRTIEINLLGSVLMSRAVLPHFQQSRYGKIIQLSGGGATKPLPMRSAYAASKAAVVRFAETLAEENRQYRIDVNAVAPGGLNTRLLDELIAAGAESLGRESYEGALQQQRAGGVPLSKGAELAVFLGSALSDGISGKLLSAVWDPWQRLSAHVTDLAGTDVYTLRRILPADRDLTWGALD